MTSSTTAHVRLPVAALPASTTSSSRPWGILSAPGATSALLAVAGCALSVAGGGWKAGAFNLLPREDGLFTSGVVITILAFAHGLRERTAIAVAAPIMAMSCYGILRFHHAPLALFGAEMAFIGVVGVMFERWRAYWGTARSL